MTTDLGEWLLGELTLRQGLPRPDWMGVWERYGTLTKSQQPEAWRSMERLWQGVLADHWAGFRLYTGNDHLLTTDIVDEDAAFLFKRVINCYPRIERALRRLGCDGLGRGSQHQILIVCSRLETFLDYTSDAYHEAHVGGVAQGVCIRTPPVHVVAWGTQFEELITTLVHELIHAALVDLELPAWIEEGLVTFVEEFATDRPSQLLSLDQIERFGDYWSLETIDHFFAGEEFRNPTDGFGLAYSMARMIVGRLIELDMNTFSRFIRQAEDKDAGAAACRALYHCELDELVPDFVFDTLAST